MKAIMYNIRKNIQMLPTFRARVRQLSAKNGDGGGVVGSNLPFKKGLENPIRFTAFFLIFGITGFGAPWFVVRHQLLRNVTDKREVDKAKNEKP